MCMLLLSHHCLACLCNSYSPCCRSQLVQAKEESVEMGGYFICNGIERIIRMLIQQRRHYIMALRRGAYHKRGKDYTDCATLIRSAPCILHHTALLLQPSVPPIMLLLLHAIDVDSAASASCNFSLCKVYIHIALSCLSPEQPLAHWFLWSYWRSCLAAW